MHARPTNRRRRRTRRITGALATAGLIASCAGDDDAATVTDSSPDVIDDAVADTTVALTDGPETAATATPATTAGASGDSPPNILIVIADDYGVQDAELLRPALATPDPAVAPTPNLTALAADGVVFDRAWANPTCSPTRAAMLTGRYGHRNGVNYPVNSNNPQGWLDIAAAYTLPDAVDAMTSLDYRSANIGKWHVSGLPTDPNDAGWDYFAGIIDGAPPSYTAWPKVVQGELVDAEYPTYMTTDLIDETIAFTGEAEADGDPWLVWLALTAPHDPFHLPPDDLHSATTLVDDEAAIAADPRPYYEAMIESMDTEIGRLLGELDLDDTYVIFLGDNGTPQDVALAPNDADSVKASLYPAGVRVPMFVAGADVVGGRRSDAPVHAVDVFTTVLELVGADIARIPADVAEDSISFAPLLQSDTAFGRDWNLAAISAPSFPFDLSAFDPEEPETWPAVLRRVPGFNPHAFAETAFARPGSALEQDGDLLIAYEDGGRELYDLTVDPWARNDLLAATPDDVGARVSELEALLSDVLAS